MYNIYINKYNDGKDKNLNEIYITMDDESDLFSYLGEEILKDQNIEIEKINGKQTIRFSGPKRFELMQKVTRYIKNGINSQLISDSKEKKIYCSVGEEVTIDISNF